MKHPDHVALLREGIPSPTGHWADFGAGSGAFTLALADLLGPGGEITAVDRDRWSVKRLPEQVGERFPGVIVHPLAADFTRPLALNGLDGIVAANALHFVRPGDKAAVVRAWRNYLRPGGRLIVVEYNVDRGNHWVPYPFTYPTWEALARQAGFSHTQLLAKRASSFLDEFYSAVSW
jgi:ubiquinone/menaquinone biosynthesis C-methylase UbiE